MLSQFKAMAPLRVLVTGAAGQIGYALLPLIAKGHMFGFDQDIILHLLDVSFCAESLGGVVMELEDCAYPLVKGVNRVFSSQAEALLRVISSFCHKKISQYVSLLRHRWNH